jgi:septum formation protein
MNFQPISTDYRLILASESPRRKSLLRQVNLPFHAVPSHVEEIQVKGNPSVKASRLAEKKARAVHPEFNNSWILGADTIVVLGEEILGKPDNHHDAESMLYLLRGKEHEVITGFCLLDPEGDVAQTKAITTLVRMKWLAADEIKAYITTGEPFGKAGGYAIQGIGAFMVESISGSYTNVVGLPVCAVIKSLLAAGALREFPTPP